MVSLVIVSPRTRGNDGMTNLVAAADMGMPVHLMGRALGPAAIGSIGSVLFLPLPLFTGFILILVLLPKLGGTFARARGLRGPWTCPNVHWSRDLLLRFILRRVPQAA